MIFKGGPQGADLGRADPAHVWLMPMRIRGGPIISYKQKVGEQKLESKVENPVTPNAQSAVADIYIYIYIYKYIYI